MGWIKAGDVSGTIPSSEAFAIQYPGYPSSLSRAIQTLGGYDSIANARSSENNKLELYFRPEDPYSHPVTSQLRPTNYLLLKISKTRKGKTSQPQLTADIHHRITEVYDFTGMADYQHVVAVHADITKKKKRIWSEIQQPSVGSVGLIDLDHQDLMIILPPRFSLKDVPENLILKPHHSTSGKGESENTIDCSHSSMNTESPLAIDFCVKEVPSSTNAKRFEDGSEMSKWQAILCELFEERPIWNKDSLVERLQNPGFKFHLMMVKRLLLAVAYYFSGGPFQRLWIRKGYDPRSVPNSRMFQIVGFRVPVSLRNNCHSKSAQGLKRKFQDLCKFNVYPLKCHSSFQLCDLEDDYIQEQIRKPSWQKKCSYASGWFSKNICDSLKLRVMIRFLSVYSEVGAQKLLKVAKKEFEKVARAAQRDVDDCAVSSNQQLVLHKVVDEDGNNDGIAILNDDEEDEENNEESDDFDEPLEMASDLPMQSQSYLTNDSRLFLQRLFDNFPSNSQECLSSEEGYQIFEQLDEEEDESCNNDYDD